MANPSSLVGYGWHIEGSKANRKGRPKGALNRTTIYRKHLLKKSKNGRIVDDIILAAIDKALTGDITALKELMDSGFGKVPDKVLTAETTEEMLQHDISQEVLKYVPTIDLEAIVKQASEIEAKAEVEAEEECNLV